MLCLRVLVELTDVVFLRSKLVLETVSGCSICDTIRLGIDSCFLIEVFTLNYVSNTKWAKGLLVSLD